MTGQFRLFIAVSIFLTCAIAGCVDNRPPQTRPTTGVVAGIVVDSRGLGVPGTVVSLFGSGDKPPKLAAVASDWDGVFTINEIPPGHGYVIKAVHQGTRMNEVATKSAVDVIAGKTTDLGSIPLTPKAR